MDDLFTAARPSARPEVPDTVSRSLRHLLLQS